MTGPYRVTLCALNSRYTHTALAPRYLRAAIARRFSSCEVACSFVEGTVNEPLSNVLSRITEDEPQLLGLSCYIWNVTQMLFLASAYKAVCPSGLVVLGGPEASYRQEELLRENPCVDFILSGEGETTLPALIQALRSGTPLSEVPSLSYREKDGGIMISTPYVGGGDPISPYADEDISSLGGRIAYLEASRGCPYQCTFCLSGRCGNVRYFDPVQVKTDVLHLASCGVRVIKFVDRTFNADRVYANDFWRWIAASYGDEIPWGTRLHFEISGERLDEEAFEILARMPRGAIQLEVGLQSFHAPTLRAIRRSPDVARLVKNVSRLTAMKHIHTHIDLIAGLPEEDYATFASGFDRAYALGANMLQLGFLKMLPGAPMREAGEYHYDCQHSKEPPYEVQQTPFITATELDKLRVAEDALERLGNSGRFRRTLRYLTDFCGISPYQLFYGFGTYVRDKNIPHSLDPYTSAFAVYAASLSGVSKTELLDCMVKDRLSTNSSGVIPEGLRNFDKRLKYVRNALNQDPARAEIPGIRRTLALLRDGYTVVFADYNAPDPVTGEYTLFECSIREILSEGE